MQVCLCSITDEVLFLRLVLPSPLSVRPVRQSRVNPSRSLTVGLVGGGQTVNEWNATHGAASLKRRRRRGTQLSLNKINIEHAFVVALKQAREEQQFAHVQICLWAAWKTNMLPWIAYIEENSLMRACITYRGMQSEQTKTAEKRTRCVENMLNMRCDMLRRPFESMLFGRELYGTRENRDTW